MEAELRARRDRAAERHDAALARHPDREGDGFVAELEAVVEELTAVANMGDVPSADPVETARTFRWLGDALFDLGRGNDREALEQGVAAYRRSEALLALTEAPLESAKLDINYGNTLRGLSGGTDVGLLEAAAARYERAARAFEALHFPDMKATAEEHLATLGPQLRLARKAVEMRRGSDRLEDLKERLVGADAAERERIAGEMEALSGVPGRGDPAGALDAGLNAIREQLDRHPERFGEQAADGLRDLEAQAARLSGLLGDLTGPPTPAEAGGSPEASPEAGMLQALLQQLVLETESGRVSRARAEQLRDLLDSLGGAMTSDGDDLDSMMKRAAAVRKLMERAADYATTPSWGTGMLEPGSLTSRLVTIGSSLKRYLLADQARPMLPDEEQSQGMALFERGVRLEAGVRAADPDAVEGLAGDVWRWALDVQEHARRHHLVLAVPDFSMTDVHSSPRSAFVSGGEVLDRAFEGLTERTGVERVDESGRGNLAQDRWNQLRSASVAIFDVGVGEGPARAQVCYEMGLALALGKLTVVAGRPGAVLPFDVDLKPVPLSGDPDIDAGALILGLDHALGTITWGGTGRSVGSTPVESLRWLEAGYGPRLTDGTNRIAHGQVRASVDDAVAFRRTMNHLLGMLGPDAPTLLLPAWPAAYPPANEPPQCFHVSPFRPAWSGAVKGLAEAACRRVGWQYKRGDDADAQRIIHGIWEEIGQASATVVDVTGHNPNVALELGLIHALGRPYRLLAQGEPEEHMFPSIEKLQIRSYGGPPDFQGFTEAVEELLGSV